MSGRRYICEGSTGPAIATRLARTHISRSTQSGGAAAAQSCVAAHSLLKQTFLSKGT